MTQVSFADVWLPHLHFNAVFVMLSLQLRSGPIGFMKGLFMNWGHCVTLKVQKEAWEVKSAVATI